MRRHSGRPRRGRGRVLEALLVTVALPAVVLACPLRADLLEARYAGDGCRFLELRGGARAHVSVVILAEAGA